MPISNERVLEAALRVWNDRGFSRTTLKHIAETLGLGELSLQRRFGSKHALMQSAFAYAMDEFCRDCMADGDLRSDLVHLANAASDY